jgi:hypothetical protein
MRVLYPKPTRYCVVGLNQKDNIYEIKRLRTTDGMYYICLHPTVVLRRIQATA